MPTVFKQSEYPIQKLIEDIDCGDLALPDIQRPFVWKDIKVRDLLDSLFKGFPVGYLLFWENNVREDFREIGTQAKNERLPKRLIIDGQQRLTALYTVFKSKDIVTKDFKKKRIKIAFRPLDGNFEVTDAAIKRDPEYIPDISILLSDGKSSYSIINDFIKKLEEKRELQNTEKERISKNIENLMTISKYEFTALEISASLEEETVANIFVRINSQGVNLTQADFVLTLLSVFWEEGRRNLEDFARDSRKAPDQETKYSSFNHIIKPDADDMLRVSVGLAFRRAKMRDIYLMLRGKDLESEEFSDERRREQFAKLKVSVAETLDNTHWHSFLKTLSSIGYKSEELISSKNAVLFSYILYLIGKVDFKLDEHELQRLIARWFFFSSITGRYSASPESTLEGDLNRLRDISSAQEFKERLEKTIEAELTDDLWNISLVNQLETSSPRSPEANAYYASLIKLGAPVLFSKKLVSDLFEPSLKPRKKRLEKHHLFPKNYLLKKYGMDTYKDRSKINQVANQTFLEFEDNIKISDDEPEQYYREMKKRFSENELKAMFDFHALPENFYQLDYDAFLALRRELMAQIIKRAFEKI